MEVFTVEEFQNNFDELICRVENGEHIGVVNENGQAVVVVPISDDLSQLYIENNNEAC